MSHYYNTPPTITQMNLLTPPIASQQQHHHSYRRSNHHNTNNNNQSSLRQYQNYDNVNTTTIDYKSKTFQLMQIVTEMQIRHTQMEKKQFYLERQLQMIHKQLQQFLDAFGVQGLGDVKERYMKMQRQLDESKAAIQKPLIKEQKLTQEYEKILSEYKVILKTQQQKMIKYQQKWKYRQNTLIEQLQVFKVQNTKLNQQLLSNQKSYEKNCQQMQRKNNQQKQSLKNQIDQLNKQLTNIKQQLTKSQQQQLKQKQLCLQLQSQTHQFKNDIQLIKQQFRQLIIQKQSLQQRHQKLKRKYKQQIQHFQMIEKQVQQKLIQVQKEIMYYKQQREVNLLEISKLKGQLKQINKRYDGGNNMGQQQAMHQDEFSFRGDNHVQTQTQQGDFVEQNQQKSLVRNKNIYKNDNKNDININEDDQNNQNGIINDMMTSECYEISIKSLLQQNNRLKRTLLLLQKSKSGQQLPPQAELQLKLLKGLMKGTIGGIASNTSSTSNLSIKNIDTRTQTERKLSQQTQNNNNIKQRQRQKQKQVKKKSTTQLLAIDFINDQSHQHQINEMDLYSPKFRHQIIQQSQFKEENNLRGSKNNTSSNKFMKVMQVKIMDKYDNEEGQKEQ